MAYDEGLVQRIREILEDHPTLDEKRMFGGVGFMIEGNIACGVLGDELIVRVGTDRYEESLEKEHTKVFDFTGRPMTGWVMIKPGGYEADVELEAWVSMGVDFALSLPPK